MWNVSCCRLSYGFAFSFLHSTNEWNASCIYAVQWIIWWRAVRNTFFLLWCCFSYMNIKCEQLQSFIFKRKESFYIKNDPSNHPIHGNIRNANCEAREKYERNCNRLAFTRWLMFKIRRFNMSDNASNLLTLLKIKKPTTFRSVSQPKIYYASMKIWSTSYINWADDVYDWDHICSITNGHNNTWN